jgi:hypothetical protein
VPEAKLDLEERLEDWLEKDSSVLAEGLLVIGRQVETGYGGYIDLLCLDAAGDMMIVELKRDRTPREITAQTLDYASWVNDLSHEEISELADDYLQEQRGHSLDVEFQEHFGIELPDVLNESHSMIIVGTDIDPSSERIVKYLSDKYGVGINAATFGYYQDAAGPEYVARAFLLEPEQVAHKKRSRGGSKRRPHLSLEELQAIASDHGVGESFKILGDGLNRYLFLYTTRTYLTFQADWDGAKRAVMNLIPGESDEDKGLRYQIYIYRFADRFKVENSQITELLPKPLEDWSYGSSIEDDWSGYAGYFKNTEDAERLVAGLATLEKGLNRE